MISNLQFYCITALIGFVLSLAFRKESEIKKWMIWTVVIVPLIWILLSVVMILMLGDKNIERIGDILRYFDARNFYVEHRILRITGSLAIVSTIYFALFFNLVWRMKNRAYQGTGRNGDKPRTTV